MIDQDGYRVNVGIVLLNKEHKVFWARRIRQHSWQFPQGGVKEHETALQAMYRELQEEIGLMPQDVGLLAATRMWLKYRLPLTMQRDSGPSCIGQKQKWFLLELKSPENHINLYASSSPEFDTWRFVDYWYPLGQVIAFKRHVYRRALEYFFDAKKDLLDDPDIITR